MKDKVNYTHKWNLNALRIERHNLLITSLINQEEKEDMTRAIYYYRITKTYLYDDVYAEKG
jgi:hypothetical protein